jgi:GT2 family glycosyltransferase/glycosyltransferase involved in cell wall biosynthesis
MNSSTGNSNVIFVHSLFRSGSTFFYHALKRTGLFHIYHEPFHEIIADLPVAWNELAKQKNQLKELLRHNFLEDGYFDEYAHLLPVIKHTFDPRMSFELFYMNEQSTSPSLYNYIRALVEGSEAAPVLQCTRTIGRTLWLKSHFPSQHIFLLRNPWDQWYSYKVDEYIAATPRIIYAQTPLPRPLQHILESAGIEVTPGNTTSEQLQFCYSNPLSPEQDYRLFFGLWLYAFGTAHNTCDLLLDMDDISGDPAATTRAMESLAALGVASVNLNDTDLHRAVFHPKELPFFQKIEEEVLQIFAEHGEDAWPLDIVRDYLQRQRSRSFLDEDRPSGVLEDSIRLRKMLNAADERAARLVGRISASLSSANVQIDNLSRTVTAQTEGQLVDMLDTLQQTAIQLDEEVYHLKLSLEESNQNILQLQETAADRAEQLTLAERKVDEYSTQISTQTDEIAMLSNEIATLANRIATLTDETVARGAWALRLDSELRDTQRTLQAVVNSSSWRLTLPLRETKRWLLSPRAQLRKYVNKALRLAKRIYQALPFGYRTKAAHRNLVAKLFPDALLSTASQHAPTPVRSPLPQDGPSTEELQRTLTRISTSDRPVVSVIIPIYGKIDFTIRCLASIEEFLPSVAFEIIVVDDCSPDNSAEVIGKIAGVRLLSNEQNLGFIRSCNAGARMSRGEYLCLLNNDTEVTSGWLDELLRTFSELPKTGLAGSKLLYPDGRLQEAGGIIWQDGSAWNFGRLQDPLLPIYNYAREADYCSGASIMVPTALFMELGGFDEHYLPAYGEDSDLALKIRDRGYRVIYQPLSVVIHHEGISSGTDVAHGIKSYQVTNSKKLFERWQDRLFSHQPPGVDPHLAKDRAAKYRVLVMDHCTPTPNQDAGSVTVLNLMLLLREMNFQVTFIPEDNFLYMPDYTTALQRAGIEVLYTPYFSSVEQHLKESGCHYDLVFMFRPGLWTRNIKLVRKYCTNAKTLYHTVDLHFLRMQREAALQNSKPLEKQAEDMKRQELAAIDTADASIVHSTAELEILRPMAPHKNIHVFPLILQTAQPDKRFSERSDIVFIGGYQHTPNVDAVLFFTQEIMPLLREALPGVRFYAVGSKPPPEIQQLASDDVIITGFVEELNPLLERMRISVAPLRFGAGIKGKIGTAMAVGLPIVATSLAVEGMSLTDGENILVADTPAAIAAAIVDIYTDENQWNSISQAGLAFAEHTWGAQAAWQTLANIMLDLEMDVQPSGRQLSLYAE